MRHFCYYEGLIAHHIRSPYRAWLRLNVPKVLACLRIPQDSLDAARTHYNPPGKSEA